MNIKLYIQKLFRFLKDNSFILVLTLFLVSYLMLFFLLILSPSSPQKISNISSFSYSQSSSSSSTQSI